MTKLKLSDFDKKTSDLDIEEQIHALFKVYASAIPTEFVSWFTRLMMRDDFIPDKFKRLRNSDTGIYLLFDFYEKIIRYRIQNIIEKHNNNFYGSVLIIFRNLIESKSYSSNDDDKIPVLSEDGLPLGWVEEWFKPDFPFLWSDCLKWFIQMNIESNNKELYMLNRSFLAFLNEGLRRYSDKESDLFFDFSEFVDPQTIVDEVQKRSHSGDKNEQPEHLNFWLMLFPGSINWEDLDWNIWDEYIRLGSESSFRDEVAKFFPNVDRALHIYFKSFNCQIDEYGSVIPLGFAKIMQEVTWKYPSNIKGDERVGFFGLDNYIECVCAESKNHRDNNQYLIAFWKLFKFRYKLFPDDKENDTLIPIPDEIRLYAVERAVMEMGKLRKFLHDKDVYLKVEEFDQELLQEAVWVILFYDSPWKALKSALLLFRSVATPCLNINGAYTQGDSESDIPYPWNDIPSRINNIFWNVKARELDNPKLENLRRSFALFCIERIETQKQYKKSQIEELISENTLSNNHFVEKSPFWREAYIRAFSELKINPTKRAQSVLRWVSLNDPNEEVRKAASVAYKERKHHAELPKKASSVRILFAAFKWLRLAHLLELGVENVSITGFNLTHLKEVTSVIKY